jgi:PEP-CTERM motif
MLNITHPIKLALASLCLIAAQAHASMVTLVGQDFDISYDTAALDALFGAPTLSGNTIRFAPSLFFAQSFSGDEVVTRTATTNLTLRLHAGRQWSNISLVEQGQYNLTGAQSFVEVGGQLRVFDLNNFPTEATSRLQANSTLSMADGGSHAWQASASVAASTNAALALATDLNLTVQNSLEAYTDSSEGNAVMALIAKSSGADGVTLQITTISAVPEPESWALGVVGLGGLFAMALRNRQRKNTI